MTDLRSVLEYAVPNDNLTAAEIAALAASTLAAVSAEEIIGMNPINLAGRMKQENLFTEDNAVRLKIAKAILALIVDSGITAAPLAAPVSAVPQKIEVTMQKTLDQMTATELLKRLVENPQDVEALTLLRAKEPIASASRVTDEWAIKKDGVLNAELTLAYCLYLGKTGARTQRQYKGGRPITIESALGIKEKALINPLIEGEIIQEGMDSSGNDWSGISRELMKAILWARRNKHQLYPKSVDPIDTFDEISTAPLPRRWAGILADYQAAVEDEEPGTEINLTWSEGRTARDPKARGPEVRTDERIEDDFSGRRQKPQQSAEELVRSRMQGVYTNDGNGVSVTGVFERVISDGNGCNFEVIVLDSAVIEGNGNRGTVYTPPSISVVVDGNGNSIKQRPMSWEKLAEIAEDL